MSVPMIVRIVVHNTVQNWSDITFTVIIPPTFKTAHMLFIRILRESIWNTEILL